MESGTRFRISAGPDGPVGNSKPSMSPGTAAIRGQVRSWRPPGGDRYRVVSTCRTDRSERARSLVSIRADPRRTDR
jgi:hypothetical protein